MAVDTVEVWLVRTGLPDPAVATLAQLLDTDEQRRAAAIADPRRRQRFVAVHGAVRMIIGNRLGAPPGELRWQRGRHGKPELAGRWTGVRVNLSHSGELGVVAVTGHRAVGVDIQQVRELDAAGLAARFFPAAEARFVAAGPDRAARLERFTWLWSRKEAYVKCLGGRLVPGLALAARGNGELVGDPDPGRVRDVPVPAGYRAAVALAGPQPFELQRQWWHM